MLNYAFDQGMFEPLFDIFCTPLVNSLLFDSSAASSLEVFKLLAGLLGNGDQTIDMVTVFALIPNDFLESFPQSWVNIIIHWKLASINDAHVHAILDGVIQEH